MPKVDTSPWSVTDPRTLQKYNAAIRTPFTTKFALYKPRKSRSCCSRVAQRPAKTAAGKAMALQTTAWLSEPWREGDPPGTSRAPKKPGDATIALATRVLPHSRYLAKRFWVAFCCAGDSLAQCGSKT